MRTAQIGLVPLTVMMTAGCGGGEPDTAVVGTTTQALDPLVEPGIYRIESLSTGKCVEALEGATPNGTKLGAASTSGLSGT
jgi:hypothetical protein